MFFIMILNKKIIFKRLYLNYLEIDYTHFIL